MNSVQNYSFSLRLQRVIICLLLLAYSGFATAASTLLVSDEAFGNNTASRSVAAGLDDSWAASYPGGSAVIPDLFSAASGFTGNKAFTDSIGSNYDVAWSFGFITGTGPGKPISTTFVPVSTGTLTIGPSNVLQSGAPNPIPSNTRISTGYNSSSNLAAMQLNFVSSPTPIYAFGIYVGDLESRVNNGTDGRVILYDISGAVIGDHSIVFTGNVDGSAGPSSYTPIEPTGFPTGPQNNPSGTYGNATTAFISVESDTQIGYAVIHVGDDDHSVNNNGSSEQLAFAGFQVTSEPYAPGMALLTSAKTVALYDAGTYAIPGKDVIYTFSIANTGTGPADVDSIFLVDSLPGEITFYNGDMDDAGPATGSILFSQSSGAGLTFTELTDVKYSDLPAKPTAISDCNYAPTGGYDANVRHICLNPKGSLTSGTPDPAVSIKFRARIN